MKRLAVFARRRGHQTCEHLYERRMDEVETGVKARPELVTMGDSLVGQNPPLPLGLQPRPRRPNIWL